MLDLADFLTLDARCGHRWLVSSTRSESWTVCVLGESVCVCVCHAAAVSPLALHAHIMVRKSQKRKNLY